VSDDSSPTDGPRDSPSAAAGDDADPIDGTPGGLSKRTLIRLLVGFGIGVPILIEAITFLGLLDAQFGSGAGDDTATTGGTATDADGDSDGVAVGEDLLPESDRSETLASAVLRESGDTWRLSLTVEVENTGETDYQFQLLTLHLADGRTVSGRASTDRLAPGESTTATGEWSIPSGSTPTAVDVVALVYEGTSAETIETRVELAKIPVRGG
jgi:hypothetical protein